jgi:hypothetical protein
LLASFFFPVFFPSFFFPVFFSQFKSKASSKEKKGKKKLGKGGIFFTTREIMNKTTRKIEYINKKKGSLKNC